MKSKKHRPSSRQKRVLLLVHRGLQLHTQLLEATHELNLIEAMLRAEALNRPFEHVAQADSENHGVEWIARGANSECHVIFPGPALLNEFPASHPELPTIRRLCGSRFSQLFTESLSVQITDPAQFRERVAHLFTPAQSAQLLRLCTAPVDPKVIWYECPPASDKGLPGKTVLP
jgi:hypothetical protein